MNEFKQILKQYWGFEDFRSIQLDVIASISKGKDTLALMPTGGGKSICFQVPALAKDGVCIVITPLIALMTDQVERLKRQKVKAAALHSGLSRHELMIRLDNAIYGAYKFLYVSPERLATDLFIEKVKQMPISFIAVDEAHCISQWGYDFRPSYLKIAAIRKHLDEVPILALTATATPQVVEDIQQKLEFAGQNVISTDFTRKNLVYFVRKSEGKLADLSKVVKSIHGSAVVYARNRKKTKEVAIQLQREGISADFYHAGLSHELRLHKQEGWLKGQVRVMVATNAFGMGIDKANVRLVVHLDLPDSLEAYFQEAGRAGRDQKKAWAVLLVNEQDKKSATKRLEVNFPETAHVRKVYQAACNYLKIPYGGGKGIAYEFKLNDFARTFKLDALTAYHSLKLLQQQGYLELTDDLNNPSRVYFILDRDDLYKFQVENYQFDGFIKLLLRSYTGLFSDYVNIDEDLLARRANITRDRVYQYLLRLGSMKVINYIPSKKTPLLVFTEERLDDKSIFISTENYQVRKERYQQRIDAMLNYGFSSEKCRSQLLLAYFGQENSETCGHCDVCKQHESEQTLNEIEEMVESIINALRQVPLYPDELRDKISASDHVFNQALTQLLDGEVVLYDSEGRLMFKKK